MSASVFTDRCASCVVSMFCEHGSVSVLQHTVSVFSSSLIVVFFSFICSVIAVFECMVWCLPACVQLACVWVQLAHVLKIDCPNMNCTCTEFALFRASAVSVMNYPYY